MCRTKPKSGTSGDYGKYAAKSDIGTGSATALCAGEGNTSGGTEPQFLRDFVRETLGDGSRNWPTSTAKDGKKPTPVANDNATAVAKDLVKELTPEEKTIVAGLLAKTIEGGEN